MEKLSIKPTIADLISFDTPHMEYDPRTMTAQFVQNCHVRFDDELIKEAIKFATDEQLQVGLKRRSEYRKLHINHKQTSMGKYQSIEEMAATCATQDAIECGASGAAEAMTERAIHLVKGAWQDLRIMDFGWALKALKAGKKVRRKNWDCLGAFLWLKPATNVKAEWCKDPLLKELAEQAGGEVPASDTICMFTAQRTILTGWIPQQSDMFAEDWEVID